MHTDEATFWKNKAHEYKENSYRLLELCWEFCNQRNTRIIESSVLEFVTDNEAYVNAIRDQEKLTEKKFFQYLDDNILEDGMTSFMEYYEQNFN